MKRAIYVGETCGNLHYGATGTVIRRSLVGGRDAVLFDFDDPDVLFGDREMIYRDAVYISSEDQTRHYPKP